MENLAEDGGADKVFVVSLHRVMTRSTDAMLSMAGMKTVHWPKSFGGVDLQEAVRGREDDPEAVVHALSGILGYYDAFSDVPFPGLYHILAREYPSAKFVLLHRDPRAWVRSVRSLIQGRELKPFEKVQYRPYLGQSVESIRSVSDEQLMAMYFSHLFAVREFFERRGELDRLCVVGISDPQLGSRISRFLGIPERDFPMIVGKDTDPETLGAWLQADPENPDPHRVRVQILEAQGDLEQAVAGARTLVEKDPGNPNTYRILAKLMEKSGRLREVGPVASKAVENGSRSPSLHRKAGLYFLKQGNFLRGLNLLGRMVLLKWIRRREKLGGRPNKAKA